MKTRKLLLLLASTASFTTFIGRSQAAATLRAREIIDENSIQEAYDYVIAGGGLAGLVLASRLSTNNTVLVLEAGLSGDDIADRISTPSGAFYQSIAGTEYDWQTATVPQENLNNRSISWLKGKILGGSSAMNAMYLVRPGEAELNAWQQLITSDDSNAATKWGWDEMYAAMKKSENFTDPLADVAQVGNIQWDKGNYGSGGPMSVSYPGTMMSIVGNWTNTLNAIGVPPLPNPNGGITLGGFVTPSSINPTNWTRSYSRSAYIDSLPPRTSPPSLLHILPQATVTRVRFRSDPSTLNGGWIADKVDYGQNASSVRKTVGVRKEVILCGGAVGTPAILMHSGFGSRSVLESAGIEVLEELEGVGEHLQDHLTAAVVWQANVQTAGDIQSSNSDFAQTPEFLSFINDAVAYVNISTLFNSSDSVNAFKQQISSALDSSAATIPFSPPSSSASTFSSEVTEGYKTIYNLLVNQYYDEEAQVELLMSLTGQGTVSIQAAIQHPLSMGRVYVNSSDPFQMPLIDPQYYSHFADIIMQRQGIKLVRDLGAALGPLLGMEQSPGAGVVTDEDIEGWLRNGSANSQFHYACSCGMLPRAQGGCVDSKLRVYGAANVRVADSSVFPAIFAAHLASATYGMAEQAAAIIQQESFTVPNNGLRTVRTVLPSSYVGMMILVLVWTLFLM